MFTTAGVARRAMPLKSPPTGESAGGAAAAAPAARAPASTRWASRTPATRPRPRPSAATRARAARPLIASALLPETPASTGMQLGELHAEQAILEARAHALRVHVLRELEGPGERPVAALHPVEAVGAAAAHGLPLPAHHNGVPVHVHLDVLFRDARHLDLDHEALGRLVHVGQRRPAPGGQGGIGEVAPHEAVLEQ